MTLDELAYDIANQVGKRDDEAFVERMRYKIVELRALFIRRDRERSINIADDYYQSVDCLDMIAAEPSECGIALDCAFQRSVLQIPAIVKFKYGSALRYLGTVDYMRSFKRISLMQLGFAIKSGATEGMYFFKDNYLYVVNSHATKITLSAVFEDPRKLESFLGCNGSLTYDDGAEFPLTFQLSQRIAETLVKEQNRLGLADGSAEVSINQEP